MALAAILFCLRQQDFLFAVSIGTIFSPENKLLPFLGSRNFENMPVRFGRSAPFNLLRQKRTFTRSRAPSLQLHARTTNILLVIQLTKNHSIQKLPPVSANFSQQTFHFQSIIDLTFFFLFFPISESILRQTMFN